MIAIIDYEMGNLRSVSKAVERLGYLARVTGDPRVIADARGLILPGVGAFRDCIGALRRRGLIDPIIRAFEAGKPYFGICLGLQILFTESEEFGIHSGLDVIKGRAVRFPSGAGLKIPHMGWNRIRIRRPSPLLDGIPDGSFFYFVHSYLVVPEVEGDGDIVGTTHYGRDFVSIIERGPIFATQFHPEKSQRLGLRLLANFCRRAEGL